MVQKTQERVGAAQGLIELFETARKRAGNDISTATLAYVRETSRPFKDGYGVLEAEPVPRWDEDGTAFISAYYFSEPEPVAGQLVLVVFTDRDFRPAIVSQTGETGGTENLNIHSKNFGVVIKL